MVINHPRIMRRNVGIIKKRLNPDSTILLQDHIDREPHVGVFRYCSSISRINSRSLALIGLAL